MKGKPSLSRTFIGFLMIFSIIGSACNLLSNRPVQVATSQPTQAVEVTKGVIDTLQPEATETPIETPPPKAARDPALVFSNFVEPAGQCSASAFNCSTPACNSRDIQSVFTLRSSAQEFGRKWFRCQSWCRERILHCL